MKLTESKLKRLIAEVMKENEDAIEAAAQEFRNAPPGSEERKAAFLKWQELSVASTDWDKVYTDANPWLKDNPPPEVNISTKQQDFDPNAPSDSAYYSPEEMAAMAATSKAKTRAAEEEAKLRRQARERFKQFGGTYDPEKMGDWDIDG